MPLGEYLALIPCILWVSTWQAVLACIHPQPAAQATQASTPCWVLASRLQGNPHTKVREVLPEPPAGAPSALHGLR